MSAIGIPDSPYLTLDEGARFCRFDQTAENPREAFRRWLHRHAVPIRKRGKVLLVEKQILESMLDHMTRHPDRDSQECEVGKVGPR